MNIRFFSLLCFLGAIAGIGCLNPPETEVIYGPEVAPEVIAAALQEAVGEQDSPALIRREEVVLKEMTRIIRGRPVVDVLSTSELTVVEKMESPSQWQIKDVEVLQTFNPINPEERIDPIVREDHKCWNKTTLLRESCELVLPLMRRPQKGSRSLKTMSFLGQIKPFEAFKQEAPPSNEKTVTFHNLTNKTYVGTPPSAVMSAPDCRGLSNCQIRITEIEFDRVDWLNTPEGYKIHYRLKISPDVPELSRFLEACQQGSVKIEGPNIDPKQAPRFLVTFFDTVRNFLPGQL